MPVLDGTTYTMRLGWLDMLPTEKPTNKADFYRFDAIIRLDWIPRNIRFHPDLPLRVMSGDESHWADLLRPDLDAMIFKYGTEHLKLDYGISSFIRWECAGIRRAYLSGDNKINLLYIARRLEPAPAPAPPTSGIANIVP